MLQKCQRDVCLPFLSIAIIASVMVMLTLMPWSRNKSCGSSRSSMDQELQYTRKSVGNITGTCWCSKLNNIPCTCTPSVGVGAVIEARIEGATKKRLPNEIAAHHLLDIDSIYVVLTSRDFNPITQALHYGIPGT